MFQKSINKIKISIVMKKVITILLLIIDQFCVYSQNPICPTGVYIPDPSAHVWKDGKLYVYGSLDESTNYYCSHKHHVLSTSDMKTWELTENSFASKGESDQVSYSDDFLYAPDVQYKKGKYYLYYCLSSASNNEGVATSTSPTGPFLNGKVLYTKGINEIDPCVFMDTDGQAYYIWGQFTAKVAKLKPNMIEIDTTTIKDRVVTESEHHFHEGGYMVKRKGIYYFVYAALDKTGSANCISYSTAKSPFGPFKYGGIIISNDHCNPGNWNNHGSLVEFKGQWYVFYHRSTHGTPFMRRACVEPIYFNKDGSINEVEMTSQGAGSPLSAFEKIEAERACLLLGNVRIEAYDSDQEKLTKINNGDKACYKYIDFGNGADSVTIRIATKEKPGKLRFNIGVFEKQTVAEVTIPGNGDGKIWQTITVKANGVKGIHAVWLQFEGDGSDLFDLDWFVFSKRTV